MVPWGNAVRVFLVRVFREVVSRDLKICVFYSGVQIERTKHVTQVLAVSLCVVHAVGCPYGQPSHNIGSCPVVLWPRRLVNS